MAELLQEIYIMCRLWLPASTERWTRRCLRVPRKTEPRQFHDQSSILVCISTALAVVWLTVLGIIHKPNGSASHASIIPHTVVHNPLTLAQFILPQKRSCTLHSQKCHVQTQPERWSLTYCFSIALGYVHDCQGRPQADARDVRASSKFEPQLPHCLGFWLSKVVIDVIPSFI